MTPTGGAHHHSLMNGRSLRNRFSNQSSWSWTSSYTTYDVLDHLFWRILCQIRIIKYCAEPSVRELPEYEGCLRLGNKFKRSLNPSRVSCQYQAVNAYHQDSFIRTLHFRTKFPCRRQRYCQTRYTRRRYDLIPRDKSRSLTLGYTQVSDLLSHGVISKSYSYGNEPLSVPTNNQKWIASRLIKSMRFTHPRSIWFWRRTILRRLHHYDAGIIIKLYSCNIIHEISHSHCSGVRQGLTIHPTSLRRELAEVELTLHEGDFLRSYVANRMLKVMQHIKLSRNRLLWAE